MMTYRGLSALLLAALTAAPFVACKEPGEEIPTHYNSARYSGSAGAIIQEVEARGAEIVAFEIAQNPEEWRAVLESVARGDDDWLDAALALNPGTSGDATDELSVAVRRALAREPEHVLGKAPSGWCLRCLCDAPDTRDARFATYRLAEAELERRIGAVKGVEGAALEGPRDACLIQLDRGREKLKRAFGR